MIPPCEIDQYFIVLRFTRRRNEGKKKEEKKQIILKTVVLVVLKDLNKNIIYGRIVEITPSWAYMNAFFIGDPVAVRNI